MIVPIRVISLFLGFVAFATVESHSSISKVVNGVPAGTLGERNGRPEITNNGEYPYMASVETHNRISFICGAVIVKRDVSLTAAHCIEKFTSNNLAVRAGSYRRSDNSSPHAKAIRVKRVLKHPGHRRKTIHDCDIAILFLEQKFKLGKFVSTIQLAVDSHVGESARFFGWGRDKNHEKPKALQTATLEIISQQKCKPDFEGHSNHKLTKSMICAKSVNNDMGPCSGDSGGPLVIEDERNPEKSILVGLTSWMLMEEIAVKVRGSVVKFKTCSTKIPAIFTNISVFRQWILKNIN